MRASFIELTGNSGSFCPAADNAFL
jgi:hypothetical protein